MTFEDAIRIMETMRDGWSATPTDHQTIQEAIDLLCSEHDKFLATPSKKPLDTGDEANL